MKEIITLGLTEGRHELPPVDGFIFPMEVDPTNLDYINNTVEEKLQSLVGIHKVARVGINQGSYDDVACFEGKKQVHCDWLNSPYSSGHQLLCVERH